MTNLNNATGRRWGTLAGVAAIVALVYGVGTDHFGNAVAGFLILGFAALIAYAGPGGKR